MSSIASSKSSPSISIGTSRIEHAFIAHDEIIMPELPSPEREGAFDTHFDDGTLHNSVVVTRTQVELGSESQQPLNILLDGHHRCKQAQRHECNFILAQVVDLPEVQFSTWAHTACVHEPEFLEAVKARLAVWEIDAATAGHMPATDQLIAAFALAGHPETLYLVRGSDSQDLHTLASLYRELNRIPDNKAVAHGRLQTESIFRDQQNAGANLLVTFRHFGPADIMELALSNRKIPAGITRASLPIRTLGENVSLGLLQSSSELERAKWQRELWRRGPRLIQGPATVHELTEPRYYAEPWLLLFDDLDFEIDLSH